MKRWFDSGVRYPHTLIIHGFLLIIARATIDNYPDVILWAGGLLLTAHLIWSVCLVLKGTPPLPIGIATAVCSALQFNVLSRLSLTSDFASGFGSGLSVFFYLLMLAGYLLLTLFALLIAYCTRKISQ